MSLRHEIDVTSFISQQIQIEVKGRQFSLHTWGNVDSWMEVRPNCYVFVEIEASQKHPNTNVLKLWPFLEEELQSKIFLIQTYFPNSPGLVSNRGRLAEWVAAKIKATFPDRFEYHKLIIDGKNDTIELEKILKEIKKFLFI
jgi:hypothetical protein